VSKTNELKDNFEQDIADGTFSRAVLAELSESDDIMPRSLCGDLGMPQGSTYKQGVASILNADIDVRHLLKADAAVDAAILQSIAR
jgi:hypothetical protein